MMQYIYSMKTNNQGGQWWPILSTSVTILLTNYQFFLLIYRPIITNDYQHKNKLSKQRQEKKYLQIWESIHQIIDLSIYYRLFKRKNRSSTNGRYYQPCWPPWIMSNDFFLFWAQTIMNRGKQNLALQYYQQIAKFNYFLQQRWSKIL